MIRRPPRSARFPYATLFGPGAAPERGEGQQGEGEAALRRHHGLDGEAGPDREAHEHQLPPARPGALHQRPPRSEEHTSELSHANISYAVFCLKKTNSTWSDH